MTNSAPGADAPHPAHDAFAPAARDLSVAAALLDPDRLSQDLQESAALWSRRLSRQLGAQIYVFHLDALPAAAKDYAGARPYLGDELAQRTEAAARLAKLIDPDLEDDGAARIAALVAPRIGPRLEPIIVPEAQCSRAESVLPLRLTGAGVVAAAVLAAPNRRWGARDDWAAMTCLDPARMERMPQGRWIKDFMFLHEAGHIQQRSTPGEGRMLTVRVLTEKDADSFALEQLARLRAEKAAQDDGIEAAAIGETMTAVRHARALAAFMGAPLYYWTAPALDAAAHGTQKPNMGECLGAGFDSQQRVLARLGATGHAVPHQVILETLFDEDPGCDSNRIMTRLCRDAAAFPQLDPGLRLRALRDILAEGVIADSFARRNAELILEAAAYFCPALLTAPAPELPVPPRRPPPHACAAALPVAASS